MADGPHRLRNSLSDRYRIERELGRGGMATVYLAEDVKHRRSVAIKVLDPELAAAIGPERFLREIEVAARLNHPHILPLHDSGVAEGLLYYVMPFVEGESLRDRLSREKQLPLDDALRIVREVADALDYAHGQGVVHRDIKPENILISRGHAVVADFGIARVIRAASDAKLTEAGLTLGTPLYMSPEQAMGGGELDGRSDLYSLGCVLYEMLAGQPPFTGPTGESLVHQHLSVAPRSVTDLRPMVPAGVVRALGRALAKTPADRFGTLAAFAEALADRESPAMAVAATTTPVSPTLRRWWLALLVGAPVILAVVALLVLHGGRPAPAPVKPIHERSEIAVLPFQNLNADGPNAYFAGGLHDELLTQLAKVAALKVISRTSVMGYQGTSKPLKQIASELGAGSVVEGSVQVVGERLRVNVQLIDAATDEHLWAERYDRTLADAFAIQSEVAQQIVTAVGAALTSAEQGRLTAAPTSNAEAYRLYLQGRDYWSRPGMLRQDRETAQKLYERALGLDPTFALAHAALSRVHGQMYLFGYDPSAERKARQREEAEAALRLAPDLPQAHVAMGMVHLQYRGAAQLGLGVGQRDFRRALDEFAIALQELPNDAEVWRAVGFAHRRMGNWDKFFAALEKAAQLNPRDAELFFQLGWTYGLVHRYAESVRAYDRSLSLAPDLHDDAIQRGWAYFNWQGQLDTLRAELGRVPRDAVLGGGSVAAARADLLLLERNADSLLQMLESTSADVFEGQVLVLPKTLYAAWAHQLRGDHAAARVAFDSARVRLDSALRKFPNDERLHYARGMALAGLGRRVEARREARWLQQSATYRDPFEGPVVVEDRARILAQAGDVEAALDEIERLLAGPSGLSVHGLRLDPIWDPIRDHPQFKALLAKYGS